MNREILKSMDTGHIPVQRLTALLETFTLKHAARMLPDLLETADLQDSSCREFLLAVLETEVKGRNERRRKRNYSAAHFPPNIRPLEEFNPEELESGITEYSGAFSITSPAIGGSSAYFGIYTLGRYISFASNN